VFPVRYELCFHNLGDCILHSHHHEKLGSEKIILSWKTTAFALYINGNENNELPPFCILLLCIGIVLVRISYVMNVA
jgi:hypothetical protein